MINSPIMPRLIVHGFAISLDGYGAGAQQSLTRLAATVLIVGFLSCTNTDHSEGAGALISPLENLGRDTLTIKAFFADCGEFGGPVETITLFAEDRDNVLVEYERDSVNCEEYPRHDRKIVEQRQSVMNSAKEAMVVEFMEHLLRRSFKSQVSSNGPDSYLVRRPSVYHSLSLEYTDDSRDRAAFKKLRDGLLSPQ